MTDFGTSNGILTIDLNAIAINYRILQQQASPDCLIAGVCKADAYGLGVLPVTKTLTKLHCPHFFVATLDEALDIRAHDTQTPIAVLGGVMTHEEKTYIKHNITPVLNTPLDIENWQRAAKNVQTRLTSILHIDTGMNRLGLSVEEVQNLDNALEGLNVRYVMSHFACADDKDSIHTGQQHQAFKTLTASLGIAQKSLANSSGLFRDAAYHYDMARPGYALYGGNPTPETTNPMQNVVTLKSRILQIRDCKKGEFIGYGASHVFEKDTRTATIACGYADGFFRNHSNKAFVYYKGQPCAVLGRVSMDMITIDINHIKGQQPQQNDTVEILGPHQGVDDLAQSAGTIGYEILTSLGRRYKRIYIDAHESLK